MRREGGISRERGFLSPLVEREHDQEGEADGYGQGKGNQAIDKRETWPGLIAGLVLSAGTLTLGVIHT